MKRYVIYKEHRSEFTGQVINYYMTDRDPVTGAIGWSVDIKDGRRFRARNWVEMVWAWIRIRIVINWTGFKYAELK